MCGIAGFQGDFDSTLLDRMVDRLRFRGPDGSGAVVVPGARGQPPSGLGHRRLSIIDLSECGRQPMTTHCPACGDGAGVDGLLLTYNGEIYNYRELAAELAADGHRFDSRTDSEVLLHLYAKHGLGMLDRLNGIFAFAIRDGRERGRPAGVERGDLLVARDPLGVKPFYHAQTPDGFLFASEIKALLEYRRLDRTLDYRAVHETLAYLWTPAPRTALASVRKLPPGHAAIVRGGRVQREWRYYTLPFDGTYDQRPATEIAAELREQLRAAVRRQMVADVPVGAFLSGGVDSSAVVAFTGEDGPAKGMRCYCIGFENEADTEGSPNDLPYARRVASHLGMDLHPLIVDPGMIGQLERMLYLLDEPQADPAPINVLLIAEQARRDGIPVLLSGAGGDDLFSGYRRHAALDAHGLTEWMPRAARRALASTMRATMAGRLPVDMRNPLARRVAKALGYADLEGDRRTASYFLWSPEELRRGLYSDAMRARLAEADTLQPMLDTLAGTYDRVREPLDRMLLLELTHFLPDHNLNYTDKTAMAAGIEVRVPLLDLELVRFAAHIPPALKQQGRHGKMILRQALARDLPHDVLYRPKSGFGVPLRRWLREELADYVADTLSPETLRARGLFDPAAVRSLIDMDRAGRVDGSYTIFALLCLEIWCRQFVDGAEQDSAPVAAVAAHVG